MIGHLRGIVSSATPDMLVVETQGLGYDIIPSTHCFRRVTQIQGEVVILTYLQVREDSMTLFGFCDEMEKKLFMQLISVSGIGSKIALGIISNIAAEDLMRMIETKDLSALEKLPGIGRKSAQKMLLDLEGNIVLQTFTASHNSEAVQALESLGYDRKRAADMVNQVLQKHPDVNVAEIIRLALKSNQ